MNNNDIIKQHITMYDLIDRCGLQLKHNAMCCPFHREKTASFKVYKNGTRFHCFGCGIDGDVITFAMNYYSLNYGQAIMRLASEFGLPIAGARQPTAQERIRAAAERKAREREAADRETEYNRLFDEYLTACDEFVRLEYNLIAYRPKIVVEPISDLYAEAVHKLPLIDYRIEQLQDAISEFYMKVR